MSSDVEGLFDREDDVFDLRQAVVLQDFGVRHGDVHTCYSGDWSVKVIEGGTCVGVKPVVGKRDGLRFFTNR